MRIVIAILVYLNLVVAAQATVLNSAKVDEVKVALIGDTESGTNFAEVLKMIKSEKANVIMINGDFGYYGPANDWKNRLYSAVSPDDIAIIGTLGNHDLGSKTNEYVAIFEEFKTNKSGLKTACTGKVGIAEGHDITAVDEVCTFGNVSVVGSAIGQVLSMPYLENRLEAKLKNAPTENWKLVGFHFTLASMNPGIKGDQVNQRFFDIIRQAGAIGAQAHTHIAMASCPIFSPFKKGSPVLCHPDFVNPDFRFVEPGTGLFVDSSVGGKEVRNRGRCRKPTEPGCGHMVDIMTKNLYTRVDGVKKTGFNGLGALFMTFNVGGDPRKAHAYFKDITGQTIFSFEITR